VPAEPPGARTRPGQLAREVVSRLRLPSPATAGDDVVTGSEAPSTNRAGSVDGTAVELPAERLQAPEPQAPIAVTPAPSEDGDVVAELVRRAQAGEAAAFAELYDRYLDMVYRYVRSRVGSPTVAEDLTSETFVRALRSIGGFTWQGRDVGAWFVTIARNLVADHYKSSRFRLELPTDDVGATGAAPVQQGPEEQVLQSLQDTVLLEAVQRLRPDQQECIVLRFLQGLSVAETAAVMGKDVGAIKSLQYRAVRTLGRLLPEGFE